MSDLHPIINMTEKEVSKAFGIPMHSLKDLQKIYVLLHPTHARCYTTNINLKSGLIKINYLGYKQKINT